MHLSNKKKKKSHLSHLMVGYTATCMIRFSPTHYDCYNECIKGELFDSFQIKNMHNKLDSIDRLRSVRHVTCCGCYYMIVNKHGINVR